jgi:hypothetical protein
MRIATTIVWMFLTSFLFQGTAFGVDKSMYSLVQESKEKLSFSMDNTENKTIYYPTSSLIWKIQFGYVGKNEASESIFFDTSGQPLFKHYQKQVDPYANRNLQHFLRSQEKSGINLQLVYLFPYFHVEGKEYACKFAQVVRVTAMQCEWKF